MNEDVEIREKIIHKTQMMVIRITIWIQADTKVKDIQTVVIVNNGQAAVMIRHQLTQSHHKNTVLSINMTNTVLKRVKGNINDVIARPGANQTVQDTI